MKRRALGWCHRRRVAKDAPRSTPCEPWAAARPAHPAPRRPHRARAVRYRPPTRRRRPRPGPAGRAVHRHLPLGFGGQAPAGPAAPGLRLVAADMQHGLGQRGTLQFGTGTAAQEHTAAHLFHTTRRAAALVLHPGPTGCGPEFGAVVATVFGELQVLRPAHQLRVDLEFGHVHRLGATFVVRHKARPTGALPICQRWAGSQIGSRRARAGGVPRPARTTSVSHSRSSCSRLARK
jgi:hypothetical protein